MREWAACSKIRAAISYSTFANTGKEMFGHGSMRQEGTPGVPPVTWAWNWQRRCPGFYSIGLANAKHAESAGPGLWNDPDYILPGYIGNARDFTQPAKLTDLTPDEQYSYMSM